MAYTSGATRYTSNHGSADGTRGRCRYCGRGRLRHQSGICALIGEPIISIVSTMITVRMGRKVTYGAVALIVAIAGRSSAQTTQEIEAADSIVLERGPCFGTCGVYRVSMPARAAGCTRRDRVAGCSWTHSRARRT